MSKFQKWHIYQANLDPVIGSEQGKSRPVLIISEDVINDLLNCVNVLPITSRKPGRRIYPNEVYPAESGLRNFQGVESSDDFIRSIAKYIPRQSSDDLAQVDFRKPLSAGYTCAFWYWWIAE